MNAADDCLHDNHGLQSGLGGSANSLTDGGRTGRASIKASDQDEEAI